MARAPRFASAASAGEAPAPVPPADAVARMHELLCDWFVRHQRDLPWRRTSDPYAIWISEAMLQQTRVEAVLGYYQRFLDCFPSVAALASSREEDLLAAWSGLGYYRRARSLREAARRIETEHAGRFPRTRAELLSLPGIGPYTAGALLSLAFDQAEPLVDGNVARVFTRLFALDRPLDDPALQRVLWELAAALVPRPLPDGPDGSDDVVRPRNWNQALMELGALVCTPREPSCLLCPLRDCCEARRHGRVAELPIPAARRKPRDVFLEIAVVRSETCVLAVQRPSDAGRMAGMWELPTREVPPTSGTPAGLWQAAFPTSPDGRGLRPGAKLGEVRHGITHHRIRAEVRAAVLDAAVACTSADGLGTSRWIGFEEVAALAWTGMARKALALLEAQAPD